MLIFIKMFSMCNFEKCYNDLRILKDDKLKSYDIEIENSLKRLNTNDNYSNNSSRMLGNLGFVRLWLDDKEELEISNEFEGLEPKTIHIGHNDYLFFKYKGQYRVDATNSFNLKKYITFDNLKYHNYYPNYGNNNIDTKTFNLGVCCNMPSKLSNGIFPKSCSCDNYDFIGYKNKLIDIEGEDNKAISLYAYNCDCCRENKKCNELELWGDLFIKSENTYNVFDFNVGVSYHLNSKICKTCITNKRLDYIEDKVSNCKDQRLNAYCSADNCGSFMNRIKKIKNIVNEEDLSSDFSDYDYAFCDEYNGDFKNTLEAIIEITNQNNIEEFKNLINNPFNDTIDLIIKKFLEDDTLKSLLTIEHFKKDNCNDFVVFMTNSLFDEWFLCCPNCLDSGYSDCPQDEFYDYNEMNSCDYCDDRFLTGHRYIYEWNNERSVCECCLDNEGEKEIERNFNTARYGDNLNCECCDCFVSSIGTYTIDQDADEEDTPFYDFVYDFDEKDSDDFRSRTKLFKIYCEDCKTRDERRVDIIPTLKELEENIQVVECGDCGADISNVGTFCFNCNDNLFFKYREGKITNHF
jgi:hypothetical protein